MITYYVAAEDILYHLSPSTFNSSEPDTSGVRRWGVDHENGTLHCTDTEQFCLTVLDPILYQHQNEPVPRRLGWQASTWFADARRGREPGELDLILNVMRVSQPADLVATIPIMTRWNTGGLPADSKDRLARRDASTLRIAVKNLTIGGKHYREAIPLLHARLPGLRISQFLPGLNVQGGFEGVSLKGMYSTYPFSWKQGGPAHVLTIGDWEGRYPMNELFGVMDDHIENGNLFCTPRIYASEFLVQRILENVNMLRDDNPDFAVVFPDNSTQE